MATNYRKYAENLIGNWNTDQYDPQRDVTLASYQTSWDKLQNDFNKYMDKLNRNLDRSRTKYYNDLATADRNSFLNTNSAVENLAKKGMLNSGLTNRYNQAITNTRGQEVNDALEKIINTNTGFAGSMTDLVNSMASGEDKLGASLAATLGGITDKEAGNNQAYQRLAASLAGGAEGRELNNALVSARIALNTAQKAEQDKESELERRILIADTLRSENMSDVDKVRYLSTYLDVPEEKGKAAVKAYNDNKLIDEYTPIINRYQEKVNRAADNQEEASSNRYWRDPTAADVVWSARDLYNSNKLNSAKNKINGLTYTDLYNLLYGNN